MNPEEFRKRLSERLTEQRPEFILELTTLITHIDKSDACEVLSWFDDEWTIHEIGEDTTWPTDVTMKDIKKFYGADIPRTTRECNITAIEFANKYYGDICEAILNEVIIDDESENDC